ncbi:rRNA-binding ribosome biosynthesis protein rpf2 [Glugoides intestinalis]
MRQKDPKTRKNLLCLTKSITKPLNELLHLRGDFFTLEESIDALSSYEKACKLMKKKKCALLLTAVNDSLCIARTYDYQPLEILKFKALKSLSSSDFDTVPAELFAKYAVVCIGLKNKRIENLFVDLFCQKSVKIDIDSVKYSWVISQDEKTAIYTIKFVRILKNSSIEDIGPCFELQLEKEFYCGDDLYEKAFAVAKPKKQKNVTKTAFKETIGKLHIEKQDLKEINLKKGRAYKHLNKLH